jgi:pimeloyl-ACP methyl ester carboxylesterase
MATYVLVHGAWHGGWCWRRVRALLQQAGHEVYTPTLTGLGERAHLLGPGIDLDTHIQDVVGVLEYEDLAGVTLVGHSYGGMVIAGVAERAAARLARLVYLDAFIPQDGQRMLDFIAERTAAYEEQARQDDRWCIPAPPLERFGVTSETDLAWARPKVGPHPYRTITQPVRITGANPLPRTYIRCKEYTIGPFAPFAERARNDPSWQYHELAAGHDAMITVPRQLAELLLGASE